ncbi:hypothetical protein CAK95_01500 [Pseudorhodoplanes sinuspersici]|uniref:Oxidoreductase molybdopterin-binding domain-containing protein n=1 Tax=Pseudorhodoplanes sinuspersici TaxID=1235591 RepID=A0A1W6ZZ78_9HYPH|nr:hypothetical protein CAK95_01500 [Pseudorhodoplanes sinuspersici]
MPAFVSASDTPGITGGRPGSPVALMMPLMMPLMTPAEVASFGTFCVSPMCRLWTCRPGVWSIGGLVDRPLELTLADIESMPRTELVAVHECAGHPFKPRTPVRRVANVRWAGVRLNLVLLAAGIGPRGGSSGPAAPMVGSMRRPRRTAKPM